MRRSWICEGMVFQTDPSSASYSQKKLAAFHDERMDELVDGALVGGLGRTELDLLTFGKADEFCRETAMGRA